tara:strand:- start:1310 stop:1780 length:471 start_codon:yes stop_codon:yes gene_type:complete
MKSKSFFLLKLFFLSIYIIFLINEELISKEIKYAFGLITTPSGDQINVEIADTILKRRLGLSNRPNLKKNWGMLFIFDKSEMHSFWMKNMSFSLDIIWLENYRIVQIHENVMPVPSGKKPTILRPLVPVNFVLEIAAGRANELNLRKGDLLDYIFY